MSRSTYGRPSPAFRLSAEESRREQNPLDRCPPLVVEVLAPDNHCFEVNHKVKAYLAAAATEVLVVGLERQLSRQRADRTHEISIFGLMLELPAELFTDS